MTLVSASPRRRELLAKLGLPFDVCPSDAVERWSEENTEILAIKNAERKIERSSLYGDRSRLLLAADTIVEVEGRVFGKPAGVESARRMLSALSGRRHSVITGLCLCGPAIKSSDPLLRVTAATRSHIEFKSLQASEIQDYLSSGEWYGKAGAYAIQGEGSRLVSKVEGDLENVVGLSIQEVTKLVREHFIHCHFL